MYSLLGKIKLFVQCRKVLWVTGFIMASVLLIWLVTAFQFAGLNGNDFPRAEREWEALLDEKDTIHLHWLRTLNPFIRETQGGLLWNKTQQKGVMRFVNLPRLSDKQRYNLWIYDLQKPLKKPVNAGMFSINKSSKGEYYVSFKPEEVVITPYKFLLTLGKKSEHNFGSLQSLLLAQP